MKPARILIGQECGGGRGRSLTADARGTAAVEFAILALPFIGLLFAILQTSLVYFSQEALQTSVQTAARTIITGDTQAADASGANSGMSKAQMAERFRVAGCAALPRFMSCARLSTEVRSAARWSDLDTGVGTLAFDANGRVTNELAYDTGNQGSIVMVRFFYVMPVEGGRLVGLANVSGGRRLMVSTSVAKTEAYL